MRASRKPSPFLQESYRLIAYCPVCDTSYNPMDARVLDEQGERHLMHIRCKKCAHSILTLVLMTGIGMQSMGILTDLTFDDVVRFRDASPVTTDDVIAIHELLETGDTTAIAKLR